MFEASDGTWIIPCTAGAWLELTPDGVLTVADKEGERLSILLPDWLDHAIRSAVLTHTLTHYAQVFWVTLVSTTQEAAAPQMSAPDNKERAFLTRHLRQLNQALVLLQQEQPAPDMPLQVADLLRDVVKGWINTLGEDWYSSAVASLDAPDLATLMRWLDDGVCEATDGCLVKPDSCCEHGHPSWLVALGLL